MPMGNGSLLEWCCCVKLGGIAYKLFWELESIKDK